MADSSAKLSTYLEQLKQNRESIQGKIKTCKLRYNLQTFWRKVKEHIEEEDNWKKFKERTNDFKDPNSYRTIRCDHTDENGVQCNYTTNGPQALAMHKAWKHEKNDIIKL